ncbi:hypothetical protein D0D75_15705 [Vibrio alginolyticus]|nr:hypothetical protein [Vibrio alginolyticus]
MISGVWNRKDVAELSNDAVLPERITERYTVLLIMLLFQSIHHKPHLLTYTKWGRYLVVQAYAVAVSFTGMPVNIHAKKV